MPDRPLRIALVGDWYLPRLGGIEMQTHDLARELAVRGHTVEIITSTPGPPEIDGIRVHRLGAPRLPLFGIVFTAFAFRRLGELLRTGGYDVVHVQFGIIAPVAYGAVHQAQKLGLATVATFHSVLRGFGFPLRVLCWLLGVERWNVVWSGPSTVVTASMRPLIGSAPAHVLPNGIDAAFWKAAGPRAPRDAGGPVAIVSVMRLYARKRPIALVRAFARSEVGGEAHLTIVGDGPQRPLVAREIARLGLADRVTLRGRLSRSEVRDALHAAEVFVLPSRLEAFGIAAVEARAAGVPVIAFRDTGVAELLRDGVDSLLVADDAGFAAAIRRVVEDGSFRRRLRCGALEATVAGWEEVVGRVMELYRLALR